MKIKLLKIAGICGLLMIVISIISILLFFYMYITSYMNVFGEMTFYELIKISYGNKFIFALYFIGIPLSLLFYCGFIFLGKKYKINLLVISGWIFIILVIIYFFINLIIFANFDEYLEFSLSRAGIDETIILQDAYADYNSFRANIKMANISVPIFYVLEKKLGYENTVLSSIFLFLGNLAIYLIAGIGLLRLRKFKVKSGLAGSFMIISGLINVSFLAVIFVSILFLKLSKSTPDYR